MWIFELLRYHIVQLVTILNTKTKFDASTIDDNTGDTSTLNVLSNLNMNYIQLKFCIRKLCNNLKICMGLLIVQNHNFRVINVLITAVLVKFYLFLCNAYFLFLLTIEWKCFKLLVIVTVSCHLSTHFWVKKCCVQNAIFLKL